jgi:hypothetical protein
MRTGVICMHQQEQERCPYLQLTERITSECAKT